MNLFLIGASQAYPHTIKEPSVLKLACAANMSALNKGPSLPGGGAKDVGVPCAPNCGGELVCEPKTPISQSHGSLKHRSDYHGYVMLLFVVVWRVCLATLRVPAPPQCALHGKSPQLSS